MCAYSVFNTFPVYPLSAKPLILLAFCRYRYHTSLLLEPGETPYENAQFLLFLAAVIKACDEHQDLLRLSVATAGNDHRLGANEAPPAIISVFLGDELSEVLEAIETDSVYGGKDKELMKIGAHVLPKIPKDTTDRNRTSPFAFTGNKFEFRMPGSSSSIAGCNIVLNTIIADELKQFADVLENVPDFTSALHAIIKDTIKNHKRIIFNGNGYDDSWVQEAEKRGLLNLRTTPEALGYFIHEENIALFERHKVLDKEEIYSRYDILLEEYVKTINIEALTMVNMARKEILPAVMKYTKTLSDSLAVQKELGFEIQDSYEIHTVETLRSLLKEANTKANVLDERIQTLHTIDDYEKASFYVKDEILPAMEELRKPCDALEQVTDESAWPFPTYGKLLFGIL